MNERKKRREGRKNNTKEKKKERYVGKYRWEEGHKRKMKKWKGRDNNKLK